MSAADVLGLLRADGFTVSAEGGEICVEPGDRLTDDAAEWIREHKAGLLELLAANNTASAKPDDGPRAEWLLHYAGRDPDRAVFSPPATWADVLERHPKAIAAEPYPGSSSLAAPALTDAERRMLAAYLERIGEDDPECIATYWRQCEQDAEARAAFLREAGALPALTYTLDDLAELDALIGRLFDLRCDSEAERAELLDQRKRMTPADVPGALERMRALAIAHGAMPDFRVRCRDCRHLSGARCRAAEQIGAHRKYEPCTDIPRHCAAFEARACH